MKKTLTILLLLLSTLNSIGADTTYYENGNVHVIFKRNQFRKEFYINGTIKQKTRYDKIWRKGKQINYDSLGQISSKGKIIFNSRKHGKWKLFEEGRVIKKNRYKYGVEKNDLYTETEKKVKCYLTYGYGAWGGPCDSAENKFQVRYIPVAGCIVTNKLLFKTAIHNFIVGVGLSIRHGFKWHEKIDEICGNSRF
jgi:hypothetical protein